MTQSSSIQVAASLLAGDFGNIAAQAQAIAAADADAIHLDIMDGHFVPNLTFGPCVVAAVNRATDLFLDAHLMMYNPFDYVERFVEAGADRITIHLEATEEVDEILAYIRRCNVQAGLALCPETSISLALRYLDRCDMLLLMTVHPGFGGQTFMPEVLEKIRLARKAAPSLAIQVDGGIQPDTAVPCIEAGATILVAGTYLFSNENLAQGVQALKHGQ